MYILVKIIYSLERTNQPSSIFFEESGGAKGSNCRFIKKKEK